MKIQCSNCNTHITLNTAAHTVAHTTTAYGRASKRVAAQTTTNTLWLDSSGLVSWEAPCCTDDGEAYSDSIEPWEYPAIEQMIEGW